ncbi:hypothetical protein A2U01_0039177, partial [Trifolium medium]|nr:hypothetical protein [Trifolium medium]
GGIVAADVNAVMVAATKIVGIVNVVIRTTAVAK